MLVHKSEPEPVRGAGRHRHRHRLAVHRQLGARLGRVKSCQNLDQRRLARAVLAKKPVHFAPLDVEGNVVEGQGAAEALRKVSDSERRRRPRRAPSLRTYFSFHSLAYPSTC